MNDRFSRRMAQGALDLLVLSALADGPKYGYLIQKYLRVAVPIPAGTLYPLLHRLEMDKLIRARWDDSTSRRRKWYKLTASGRQRLTEQAQDWVRLTDCVQELFASVLDLKPKPV